MKTIGVLRVAGIDYDVVFASKKEIPELDGLEAVTIPSKCLIAVHKSLRKKPSRARVAVLHEVLHAVFSSVECAELERVIFKCKKSKVEEIEESIVTLMSILLSDATLNGNLVINL